MTALQLLEIVESPVRLGDYTGWDYPPQARSTQLPRFGRGPVLRPRMAMSEIDRRIARLNTYLHRQKSINPIVVAQTVGWLLRQQTVGNQADLALRLGVDESWVSRTLRILDLPDDLKERVAASHLLISLESAAQIARLQDRRWQAELVGAMLEGKSETYISKRIAQLKGKVSPKRFTAKYSVRHKSRVTIQSQFKILTTKQERETVLDVLAEIDQRAKTEEARALE